ncbi:MAG: choice-of-anchor Q domain-containing protein, partial [Candidatus Cloacimonadaceae bacterium]|nr:choice-of-anchor Q domain-containing protein [Candidatus Cloacimonadaceae bacterium]
MLAQKHGVLLITEWEASSFDSLVLRNITTPERAVYILGPEACSISKSTFENIHSTYTSPDTPGDDSWGGALFSIRVWESLSITNSIFRNFSVQNNQPTLHISRRYNNIPVDIEVNNCLFENIRTNYVIPIAFHNNIYGEYRVSNCTFYDNYGDGAAVGIYGNVVMRNNIFLNPDASHEIKMHNAIPDVNVIGNLDFDYNNIPGGINGIYNPDPRNTLIYGQHNISSDPTFASTIDGDPDYLRLAAGSPCINAGTPDISGLNLPPFDLDGNWRVWDGRIDMGCYEYGSEPWVSNDDPIIPQPLLMSLDQNYPNPFNPSTTISFTIPASSHCRLDVYNMRGQKVTTLLNDNRMAGKHSVMWNGLDDQGSKVSSGIYIY